MKNPDPNAQAGTPADPDAQEVDVGDVDLSAEPPSIARRTPPPLPPSASWVPPVPAIAAMPAPQGSTPPPPPQYASQAPPLAASPARSPMFFVGIIVAVLVVAIGAGFVVSRTRRPAPVVATSPSASAAAAPKMITIPVVDMDDVPDAGP